MALHAKRCFDICVAVAGIILLAPLTIALAGCVYVFIGKPVFFGQVRPGIQGKPFRIWKLRTMRETHVLDSRLVSDSARLTHFGRFLRSTSLDELPELWNVLTGDMSLVGPRPLLMEYLPLYTPEQSRRHDVRPGITGWAQVKGRNLLSWEEKFALDIWYVDNRSFLLDLHILFLSIRTVLKREGISHAGNETMPKFTGTAR